VLIALGGIEEFFSGQLDIGKIHIQLGLEGLQAIVIPVVLVLLAVLIALMPVHRIFYGIIALVLALYSLIGVNLGGFIIGMLLATVGGVLVVSWLPKAVPVGAARSAATAAEGDDDEDAGEPSGLDLFAEEAPAGDDRPQRGRKGPKLRGAGVAAIAALALGLAATAPQPAQAATTSASAASGSCLLGLLCLPSSSPSSSPSPTTSSSSPSPAQSSSPSPTTTAPSASPLPLPGASGSSGSGGTIIAVPGQNRGSAPAPGTAPVTKVALPSGATTGTPLLGLGADNSHGIFTLPSANATGDSLQISGTSQIGVVTVPLADGTRATAIRIECSQLTIGDFHLDTKNRKEIVNLDTGGMTLSGHVVVWIDRIGTQYGGGAGLAQSLKANPLTLGALMTLLGQGHLVLGLVGAQADDLSYSNFHETAALQSSGF